MLYVLGCRYLDWRPGGVLLLLWRPRVVLFVFWGGREAGGELM